MQGAKPARRIVTIDDSAGQSTAVQDGPAPDVRIDPARPGFMSTRIWLTDRAPPRIGPFADPTLGPHTLEPPKNGSVCRIVTFPPDATFKGRIGSAEVAAYFNAMGSPGASTYSAKAPHPYMQKVRALDICVVLEGEITLVLDKEEVHLSAGDTVVQRGTNHAWANRGTKRARVAFVLVDAEPLGIGKPILGTHHAP